MRIFLLALLLAACSPTTKLVVDGEWGTIMSVHDLSGWHTVLTGYPSYNFANEFYRLKVGDTILYLKKSNRIYAVYLPTWRDISCPRVKGAWMAFNYCDDWIKYEPKCKCK